ncbi:transposase [Texcoconibacillus texcoconensis]|uniref:REP element-mobilizing transposase RayT n=1 Tax=Texcoconibacillus texcoconensis TaxID=1095777 RepID=A0A840QR63_9BACI|nr:transposase [Texcoconibacillus texcoconensis]MBB5173813.1 REP element-mobilizing transposase RayT [Texcoconibacillus texcoconensis]
MAYQRRKWVPHYFYHINTRGNSKKEIFHEEADYYKFLKLLTRAHEKIPYELCAYCLMSNHYHLLLRAPYKAIPKIMFHLNKRYADYYNRKYDSTGHVFEKRYHDNAVKTAKGLLVTSAYIHTNPYAANLVSDLTWYPWSSVHYFSPQTLKRPPQFLDPTPVLTNFPGTEREQKLAYMNWLSMQAVSGKQSTHNL